MRRRLALLAALAVLGLGAGCGGSDDSGPPQGAGQPGAAARDCESAPPSSVADGVNDDQGGSRPGTDPCAGE